MEITEAHEKRLKSLGKSAEWYQEKFAEQHGTCAVCRESQKRIGLDGKPRPLVANVAGDCLLCQKCSARQNKRNQRERDSEYKRLAVSKRNDREGAESGDAFWTRNRRKLSESEKVQFEARDEEVLLLVEEMEAVLAAAKAGRKFDEPALRDFTREVCQEVLEHGTVFADLVLTDFFKPERKELYDDIVAKGGANAIFVEFGYYQAIPCVSPNSIVSRFLEFTERRYGLPIAQFETFATRIGRILDVVDYGKVWKQLDQVIRCATKGCKGTKNLPPREIPSPLWWCATCEAERNKAGHAALVRIGNQQLTQQRSDSVYDSYGRFKDRERQTVFDDAGKYGG